jgi:hypothetical protein
MGYTAGWAYLQDIVVCVAAALFAMLSVLGWFGANVSRQLGHLAAKRVRGWSIAQVKTGGHEDKTARELLFVLFNSVLGRQPNRT